MFITKLKSKIHRAVVTNANLSYEGSITISRNLMNAANIVDFEKVLVADINTGSRFETYAIPEEAEGVICINGAAAKLAHKGDLVIIMTFCLEDNNTSTHYAPTVVKVDCHNHIQK